MSFAQDLRASVLQAAMQGKLTEQLTTDTPVSELLADIKAEKDRLISEKKIKKEKPLSAISDDDIPFDIPESWEWVRLGDFCKCVFMGKSPVYTSTPNANICIGQKNNQEYGLDFNGEKYVTDEFITGMSEYMFLQKYDVLLNTLGTGTVGRSGVWCGEKENTVTDGHLLIMRTNNYEMSKYLLGILRLKRQEIEKSADGSTNQKFLKVEDIRNYLIPVPPIEEQKRIVRRIEEIMIRINELEAIEEELKKLKEVFPADMKAAVLQAAMQGKLTEQLETDSSVDDLLEDIKKEREKLIAEGKIKKSRTKQNDNFVQFKDGEEPFDIPDDWRWVRFGDVVQYNMGKTPPRAEPEWWKNDYPWVSISDMPENGHIFSTKEKISKKALNEKFSQLSPAGTLLMSFKLTVGRVSILDIDAVHNEAIISIYPHCDNKKIMQSYLFYILPFIANAGEIKNAIKGKTLNSESIYNLVIPFPPLEEQNRIVAKLEQILPLISDLS